MLKGVSAVAAVIPSINRDASLDPIFVSLSTYKVVVASH
jgi:hypothetical protein